MLKTLGKAEIHLAQMQNRISEELSLHPGLPTLWRNYQGSQVLEKLTCSLEYANENIEHADNTSDPSRDIELEEMALLLDPPPPGIPLDMGQLRLKEMQVIHKGRASPATRLSCIQSKRFAQVCVRRQGQEGHIQCNVATGPERKWEIIKKQWSCSNKVHGWDGTEHMGQAGTVSALY